MSDGCQNYDKGQMSAEELKRMMGQAQSSFAAPLLLGALVEFIEGKLIDAASTLHARAEMERTWREGTDEMWRAVGCTKTKAQRLKDSAMHGRIAKKNRKEVEMFKAVLEQLKAPNAELSDGTPKI